MTFKARYIRNLLLATPMILAVAAPTASAQEIRCAPRASLLEYLADTYKERQVGTGITQQGALMEIMASEKGSWSIILSTPEGLSCLMAAGKDWQAFPPQAPEGPLTSSPLELTPAIDSGFSA